MLAGQRRLLYFCGLLPDPAEHSRRYCSGCRQSILLSYFVLPRITCSIVAATGRTGREQDSEPI